MTLQLKVQAQERPWLLSKGAAAREAKRFNLYDWIDQKNKQKVADLWLSMNSASPYEFMIGLHHQTLESTQTLNNIETSSEKYQINKAEISAYADIVGLTIDYQKNSKENFSQYAGLFNLRVFGETIQGTHLTLHYGLQKKEEANKLYSLNQQFGAVTLQVYIFKYFGFQSHNRYYLKSNNEFWGEITSVQNQYSAFIDFSSLRIIGGYLIEKQNSKKNSDETKIKREGTYLGLQLFF